MHKYLENLLFLILAVIFNCVKSKMFSCWNQYLMALLFYIIVRNQISILKIANIGSSGNWKQEFKFMVITQSCFAAWKKPIFTKISPLITSLDVAHYRTYLIIVFLMCGLAYKSFSFEFSQGIQSKNIITLGSQWEII